MHLKTTRESFFVKRILSRFCACSGSQKFSLCSGPEQSHFPRFYAAKCRSWISSLKNLSLYYTSVIRNRFVWIILYSSDWFQFYFTVPSLNLSKIYKFSNMTYIVKSNLMSDPSKRQSNIFQESRLTKEQQQSTNRSGLSDLANVRSSSG